MPDPIDLEPSDYRDRKPKGWRWRLPWTHPEDSKSHLVGLIVACGCLIYVFLHRDELSAGILFGGAAMAAFVAGIMFTQAFRE